jgi:HSP20 family protein
MALIRWEPTREINTIQQEVNRLFGTLLDSQGDAGAPGRRWIPAMDLVEEGDHYVLRADLPGLSEKDVHIEVDGNVLTVSGERSAEREQRKEGYYRVERASGHFSRSLTLPEGVDPEQIKANVENGVLEVTIPKPEQSKPRRVEVEAGRGDTIEASAPAQEDEGRQAGSTKQREPAKA